MFLSHDQVEGYQYIITGIFAIGGGLVKYFYGELKETTQMQWKRIDDLREDLAKKVTLEQHEAFRKEMREDIDRAIKPLTDSQIRIENKLDSFIAGINKSG